MKSISEDSPTDANPHTRKRFISRVSPQGALRCTVSLLTGSRRRGAAEISHTINISECIETDEKSSLELTKAIGT
ncbi:hypothetical protein R3I93_013897 [Phoxinus phoxinus]|uniref:Uncharacterized protein n=1 Tax=Phoxinus phoxinus TaxID=58324 RepID=A0AAN9CTI0_9TELE